MSKSTFFSGQPVFSQLLNLIPDSVISGLSPKHRTDHYCKKFMTRDHLVSMLYACFFQCTAIRELITGLQANSSRLGHLGLVHTPRRSTLADANARRSPEFFAQLYHHIYKRYFLPDSRCLADKLFIIDSTTISLFNSVMQGAGAPRTNGKKKGGLKAHMLIDADEDVPAFIRLTEAKHNDLVFTRQLCIPDNSVVVFDMAYNNYTRFNQWEQRGIRWVTRQKKVAFVEVTGHTSVSDISRNRGVLKDEKVRLGRPSNNRITPLVAARRIEYFDKENNRTFTFITNDQHSLPEQIADFYKKRWQIELLFKRIKQRYPLKYFLGDNPNAIQIQVWSALLCDLLVKIVQKRVNHRRKRPWAYASISAMIKHHLMTYINLYDFLQNPERALTGYKPPPTQLKLF